MTYSRTEITKYNNGYNAITKGDSTDNQYMFKCIFD